MSEAILLQNTVNKPGTSCLGCRRRKLKCSREPEGCYNCQKSELPCVYPQPDVGVKRKRGPYKKDKPPRQRHLEDLVKYLEPKAGGASESPQPADSLSPGQASSSGSGYGHGTPHPSTNGRPLPQAVADEQSLVKDALVALTRATAQDEDLRRDDGGFGMRPPPPGGSMYSSARPHPNPRRIFEYWQLFVTRVDPMVKIIHCPTFYKKVLNIMDNHAVVPWQTNAMMFSIYYAVLSTCSAQETRERFGEGQEILTARYEKLIKDTVRVNHERPQMEGLQALVLYMICMRRTDSMSGIADVFHQAVLTAQLIKLEEEPDGRYPPFEVEYRRRLWFHLCGLESRTAEEGGARKHTVLKGKTVEIPRNLNDCDLDPKMKITPESREGVTDSTFPILRFEVHRLVFGIWNVRGGAPAGTPPEDITRQQQSFYEESLKRLQRVYMRYLNLSRPYDWLCDNFLEGMLAKARLLIKFPTGTVPSRDMAEQDRMTLLHSSVDIINRTHVLAVDERISDWAWYFRGYVQWHSIAIVVAELGWNRDAKFVTMAWNVLDDILLKWDDLYRTKQDDPAWTKVNDSIQRARKARPYSAAKRPRHSAPQHQPTMPPPNGVATQHVANMQQPLQHRPASISHGTVPQQYTQYPHSVQALTPAYTDGQTPESQASGGSGAYEGDSPPDWNFDPFTNLEFNAWNTVLTNDVWDQWEPMHDIMMGYNTQNSFTPWYNNAGAGYVQYPHQGYYQG
ncbi:Putative zn(2)-C6 fungal-type DNA-binding domain-containing protein [Septoria linicola]|uniref:Zn(2)-C6 fungal-type DNA-binding domain-containing protein n=1 Tax=Septoria linicola TaxID=215465 RepID=A0A9Q9EI41_9PEZI|nr:Putative zn(2)-C6 fungal-type DNA-binding domain-containing protein [Septoria linicola]